MKNPCYQNSQINTCKNEAWKPLFIRDLRGYSENEKSPCRALTPCFSSIRKFKFIHSENEKSPCRALTHFSYRFIVYTSLSVKMRKARVGR